MAESCSSGDEEFRGETKYKQFSAAVERALKGFELSAEWHDLISSLARLNKVYTCADHVKPKLPSLNVCG